MLLDMHQCLDSVWTKASLPQWDCVLPTREDPFYCYSRTYSFDMSITWIDKMHTSTLTRNCQKIMGKDKEVQKLRMVSNCYECELWGWGLVHVCRARQVWAGRCTTEKMVLASTTFPRGLCCHSSVGTGISGRSSVEIYRCTLYECTCK